MPGRALRAPFLASLVLAASPAASQDLPAWFVRAEAGAAGIHHSSIGETWLGARVGRAFGQTGGFALDAGVAGAEGFTTVTAGLELRLGGRHRLSPFFRAELGHISEDGFGYVLAGLGAGLAVRIDRRLALRAGGSWSHHSTDEAGAGPVCYYGGLELGW
jgi:hypothetical protein